MLARQPPRGHVLRSLNILNGVTIAASLTTSSCQGIITVTVTRPELKEVEEARLLTVAIRVRLGDYVASNRTYIFA
jgi:hypothetical protein